MFEPMYNAYKIYTAILLGGRNVSCSPLNKSASTYVLLNLKIPLYYNKKNLILVRITLSVRMVAICVYARVHMYVHTHYTHVYMCVYCVCVRMIVFMCMYAVYTYVHMHIYACKFVSVHVCIKESGRCIYIVICD